MISVAQMIVPPMVGVVVTVHFGSFNALAPTFVCITEVLLLSTVTAVLLVGIVRVDFVRLMGHLHFPLNLPILKLLDPSTRSMVNLDLLSVAVGKVMSV
jgi:hypothetical protein